MRVVGGRSSSRDRTSSRKRGLGGLWNIFDIVVILANVSYWSSWGLNEDRVRQIGLRVYFYLLAVTILGGIGQTASSFVFYNRPLLLLQAMGALCGLLLDWRILKKQIYVIWMERELSRVAPKVILSDEL
ncbi:unnamed protein product [Sphagnum balticum]